MSKIQKQTNTRKISLWEEVWTADEFKSHESDFLEIQREVKSFPVSINPRLIWLEKKGAIKIVNDDGYIDFKVRQDYSMYDSMYSKYCEWLSFQEKKMGIKPQPLPKISIGAFFEKTPELSIPDINYELSLATEHE